MASKLKPPVPVTVPTLRDRSGSVIDAVRDTTPPPSSASQEPPQAPPSRIPAPSLKRKPSVSSMTGSSAGSAGSSGATAGAPIPPPAKRTQIGNASKPQPPPAGARIGTTATATATRRVSARLAAKSATGRVPATASIGARKTSTTGRVSAATSTVRTAASTTTTATAARGGSRAASRPNSRTGSRAPTPTDSAASSESASGPGDVIDVSKALLPGMKKVQAWDIKGKMSNMEIILDHFQKQIDESKVDRNDLKSELDTSRSRINELEQFRSALQTKVVHKEQENGEISRQLSETKFEMEMNQRRHKEEMAATESRFKTDLNNLRNDYDDLKRVKRNLEQDLEERELQLTQQKNENVTLRGTISAQSANFLQVESDMRGLKLRLEATETTLRMREERINQLERDLDDANKNIEKMEAKIRDEEQVRRKLHNTIQELKGNIRVFCRVRPLLSHEIAAAQKPEASSSATPMPTPLTLSQAPAPTTATATATATSNGKSDVGSEIISEYIKFPECEFSNEIELLIAQDGKAVSAVTNGINPPKSHAFTFDRVFEPSATQAQVFEEISQLVQSALDGYPVCIFAYGQTSAGKTWTMEGAGGACTDESKMGMIPRAVRQIFETSEKLKSKGWVYTMEAQFVEIYNETVHDLLNPNGAGASGDINKYEIKHHPNGKTTVTNCTTAIIESPQTLQVLFARASKNRAVAATNCNDRSSRSHSVFTLRLHGKNSISEEVSEGVLNLVDLAGSERLSQSGSTGDRLKETKAINSSLSCLGDVISALANKDAHIPYRNSKLTYLLQNSLGGNSKTLMFVNVSPLKHSLNESLCSLRFAAKVNACNIGTARRVVKA